MCPIHPNGEVSQPNQHPKRQVLLEISRAQYKKKLFRALFRLHSTYEFETAPTF